MPLQNSPRLIEASIGSMHMLPENYFLGKQGEGVTIMQLLTKEIITKLPILYSQENEEDPMVICKFFLSMTKWTWFATEFDGKDSFFGYVVGEYPELGYFSLSELESVEGPYGLKVERDRYFEPTRLTRIKKEYESREISIFGF